MTAAQRSAVERAVCSLFLAVLTVAAMAVNSVAAAEPTFSPAFDIVNALPSTPPDTAVCASCEEPPPDPAESEIVISFVGDCMLASMLGSTAYGTFGAMAQAEEPSYFFSGVSDIFFSDDWTVANCENVFTDNDSLQPTAKGYTPAYWYRSAAKNANIFTAGGVDIVSVANNHSLDYGREGYNDTVEALEAAGLQWGDDGKTIWLEKAGVRIALLCRTLYYSGAEAAIAEEVRSAKADGADYVIVYYHGGTERVYEPDGWRVRASHTLVDAGADLVLGNHPHVLQPVEIYNGKTIVHSLGNFLFGGSLYPENRTIIFRLTLTSDGETVADERTEIIPCYVWTTLWRPGVIENEAERSRVLAFMAGEAPTPLE